MNLNPVANYFTKFQKPMHNIKTKLARNAAQKIKQLLQKTAKPGCGLRFTDIPSPCKGGYNYHFELASFSKEDEITFFSHDVCIYIPKASLSRLQGCTIELNESADALDLSEISLDKIFHVKNPNAKGLCPCACGNDRFDE